MVTWHLTIKLFPAKCHSPFPRYGSHLEFYWFKYLLWDAQGANKYVFAPRASHNRYLNNKIQKWPPYLRNGLFSSHVVAKLTARYQTSVISLFATIRDCSPLLANIYYSGFSDTRNRRHFCFAFLFAKRASEDLTIRAGLKWNAHSFFCQPITNFKFFGASSANRQRHFKTSSTGVENGSFPPRYR